jgi:hypothetical protein
MNTVSSRRDDDYMFAIPFCYLMRSLFIKMTDDGCLLPSSIKETFKLAFFLFALNRVENSEAE